MVECPKCLRELPLDNFAIDSRTKSGHRSDSCKDCYNNRTRELRRIRRLKKKGLYFGTDTRLFQQNKSKLEWAYQRFAQASGTFTLSVRLVDALEDLPNGLIFYRYDDLGMVKVWLPDGIRTYTLATTKIAELAKVITESQIRIIVPEELNVESYLEKRNDGRKNKTKTQ